MGVISTRIDRFATNKRRSSAINDFDLLRSHQDVNLLVIQPHHLISFCQQVFAIAVHQVTISIYLISCLLITSGLSLLCVLLVWLQTRRTGRSPSISTHDLNRGRVQTDFSSFFDLLYSGFIRSYLFC